MLSINGRNVLMIDIPTYAVRLPKHHKELLKKRLHAQVKIWQDRTGIKMLKGGLPYSRGMLTLAACLEQHNFAVKYLVHADPVDRAQIPNLLKEANYVCIYVMTPTLHIATEICRLAKQLNPRVVTVLGGPHINSRPVETLREDDNIDFTMIGEAENRLPTLLQSLDKPDSIGGTAYRLITGEVQLSVAPTVPVTASELPMPAYHLLGRPFDQYSHHIKTFRGCPYGCNFCLDRQSWRSAHQSEHSIDQVLDELTYFSERLPSGTLVHFSDSILNLNWDRTSEILERIKQRRLNQFYAFDTRVDLVKEEQVKQLVDAGFIYFRMGFESVHDHVLKISDKASTREKELEASSLIRSSSQRAAIHAYILTGLPGSTRESLSADVVNIHQLVSGNIVDTVGNKILVPYPGIPYGDRPEQFGIQTLSRDYSKYDRRSYPVYRLNEVSADEIYFGYLEQEAALTQAYLAKLRNVPFNYKDIVSGLGYVYRHYVDTIW